MSGFFTSLKYLSMQGNKISVTATTFASEKKEKHFCFPFYEKSQHSLQCMSSIPAPYLPGEP